MIESVAHVQQLTDVAADKTILIGFSQGAMMSLGVVLAAPTLVGGAWLMSGAALPELMPHEANPSLSSLPILVQHGTEDAVVSIERGRTVPEALRRFGALQVTYREYPMGHTIGQESFEDAMNWLNGLFLLEAQSRNRRHC